MLLNKFRNKQIYLFSTLLLAFAILARMLVPIAHASNAAGNQKGFLASLCSGNQIVFVALDLPNNKPQPSTMDASGKCPLCNILEQEPAGNVVAAEGFRFNKTPNHYGSVTSELPHSHLTYLSAIRAPPRFS